MSNPSDKRKFNRFPIDFVLEVSAESIEGKKFLDKASLKDVSGEGVKFLTQKSDMYFPGQLLGITIFLPGTDEIEAHMKAKAIVVRIDPPNNSEKDNKSRGRDIAIKFETRLNFEKIGV